MWSLEAVCTISAHSMPNSREFCVFKLVRNSASSRVVSRNSLRKSRQVTTSWQMYAHPFLRKRSSTSCIYSMGMALLMRLSSHPLRKHSANIPRSSMWRCRSFTRDCRMAVMLRQCTRNCSKPCRQTSLSSWYSIISTSAQKVRLSSLMWYSNTPAIMFTPCTYPISMSQTEQAVRTRFSIALNSPLREKVGHSGCVRGRSFSICTLFSSEGRSLSSFSQALRSDFSQPLVHSRFQGHWSPQRQPLSPSRSVPMPQRRVNLFQLKKGLMVLYSMLSVMTVSLRREGMELMLSLLGDPASVSDFFFVFATVEHLLMTILDLGFSSLMRCVAPSDWKPDHRDCALQLLLATDRLSSSASRQEPVQVQAKQMGEDGFIGEFNYIV